MGPKARLPHVNFHIGAPRIASDIISLASQLRKIRTAKCSRFLSAKEFRQHIRPIVNASRSISELDRSTLSENEKFWKQLQDFQVLAASQHAMMGHPKVVFQRGAILPNAELRIERLSALFDDTTLDLHLTIVNQLHYLSRLPLEPFAAWENLKNEAVPSWFELILRIKKACPKRRILVWDFKRPEHIALPFSMTVLNVDEASSDQIRKPISEAIAHNKLLSKVFKNDHLPDEIGQVLDEQYEKDLGDIEAVDNVVLVRSDEVPKDLHV